MNKSPRTSFLYIQLWNSI